MWLVLTALTQPFVERLSSDHKVLQVPWPTRDSADTAAAAQETILAGPRKVGKSMDEVYVLQENSNCS